MKNMLNLFFTETDVEEAELDASHLKNELDSLRLQLRDRDAKIKGLIKDQEKQQVSTHRPK